MVALKRVEKFFDRKTKEFFKRRKARQAFEARVGRVAQAAGRRERLKQEARLAVETEKILASRRLKRFRTKRKGDGLGSFASQFQENFQRTFGGAPTKKGGKTPSPFEL